MLLKLIAVIILLAIAATYTEKFDKGVKDFKTRVANQLSRNDLMRDNLEKSYNLLLSSIFIMILSILVPTVFYGIFQLAFQFLAIALFVGYMESFNEFNSSFGFLDMTDSHALAPVFEHKKSLEIIFAASLIVSMVSRFL